MSDQTTVFYLHSNLNKQKWKNKVEKSLELVKKNRLSVPFDPGS